MSILINKDTKVVTQGITGKTGQFHTEKCQEYANGKNCFVAGVNPKKAGEKIFDIPIFASMKENACASAPLRPSISVASTHACNVPSVEIPESVLVSFCDMPASNTVPSFL